MGILIPLTWLATLANAVWLMAGPVLWCVLGAATLAAGRRARLAVSEAGGGSGTTIAARTRFARPAMITACVAVGLMAVFAATAFMPALSAGAGALPGPLDYLAVASFIAVPLALIALAALLVAALVDVSRTRTLPGRETVAAYCMVLAVQVGVGGFALAYGVLRANGAWV